MAIFNKLVRQKRRLIFSVVAVMLAASLIFGGGPQSLLAGAIAAALCVHIILLFPNQRRLCETTALGFWFAALLDLPIESLPVSTAAGAALFWTFLYGTWTERAGWHLASTSSSKAHIDLPADQVWSALIPGESHPDDYWSGTLVDFDHDSEDADTVYLRFDSKRAMPEEMTLTFLEREPNKFCRYYLERDGLCGFEDMTVTVSMREPDEGSCDVETTIEQLGISVGNALLYWFDNSYGDELGAFAARVQRHRAWSIREKNHTRPGQAAA